MQLSDAAIDYTVGAPAGVTPDWLSSITSLGTQALNLYGQLRLQDLNMKLIGQGKPPLTAAQTAAMAPQLNVGLSPDIQDKIFQYTVMGGIGVIAIVILMGGKKSRR